MKKLALALSMTVAVIATPAVADQTVTTSVWLGPQHPVVSGGYQAFVKAVEDDPNSGLNFNLLLGGSLLGPKATLSGVRDGVADIGFVVMSYHPAEFPHGALFGDLAMRARGPYTTAAAVTELTMLHCAPCQDEFKRNGVVYTGSYSTTPYYLIAKKELKTPEDLKGLRMRTPGGAWDRWVTAVGGVPVNVPASEVYEAISRNMVDVALLPIGDFKSYNLFDVATHATMMGVGTFYSNITMAFNPGFWSGLSDDQRRIVLDNAGLAVLGVADDYVKADIEAEVKAREAGVQFVEPSAEMLAQKQEFRDNDLETVLELARDRYKIEDPEGIIETFNKLLDKYDGLFEGKRDNLDEMLAILNREVYDKVDVVTYGQ